MTSIPSPQDLGLRHESWRPNQYETVQTVVQDDHDVVIVEAPTGTGKTDIALGAARLNLLKTFTLTMNHSLQDQYVEEGNGKVIKVIGRANYECILPDYDPHEARERGVKHGTTVDIAPCAGGYECPIKTSCPYFVNRDRALRAGISSHNYAFWLPESTYSKGFTGADLLVCDEGHLLDNVLCEFASCTLSTGRLRQLESWNIPLPTSERIDDWAEVGIAAYNEGRRIAFSHPLGTVERAQWLRTTRFYEGLANLEPQEERWVVDRSNDEVKIRPVWPVDTRGALLGGKTKKVLIMSATILDVKLFTDVLGLTDYSFYKLPWVFPPESRPIYYRPVGVVTQETMAKVPSALGNAISYILDKRRGEKGAIHTNSYMLQNAILPFISDHSRLIIQSRGDNRTEVINRFKLDKSDSWIVSPSISHGEDFTGDIARNQIICKMPFADMRDKVVRIRQRQMPRWYKFDTAQKLVQTIGRVTRSESDYGETWILDAKFESVVNNLPDEIKEAIR